MTVLNNDALNTEVNVFFQIIVFFVLGGGGGGVGGSFVVAQGLPLVAGSGAALCCNSRASHCNGFSVEHRL